MMGFAKRTFNWAYDYVKSFDRYSKPIIFTFKGEG